MAEYHKCNASLYPNKYKQKDSHPDWNGKIDLTTDQVRTLTMALKAGDKAQLKFAAWNRQAKTDGKPYMYFSFEVVEKDEYAENFVPKNPNSAYRPARQDHPKMERLPVDEENPFG